MLVRQEQTAKHGIDVGAPHHPGFEPVAQEQRAERLIEHVETAGITSRLPSVAKQRRLITDPRRAMRATGCRCPAISRPDPFSDGSWRSVMPLIVSVVQMVPPMQAGRCGSWLPQIQYHSRPC